MKATRAELKLDANLEQVTSVAPTTRDGCEDCIKMAEAGEGEQIWVHLNLCRTCGHVGCCDNSPNKHATKHFHSSKHPIMQRFEPGEDWGWDYAKRQMLQPFPAELATAIRHKIEEEGYVYGTEKRY